MEVQAPELFEGQRVTEKVDQYSFAVLVWEMLTGKLPWASLSTPLQASPHCPSSAQGRGAPIFLFPPQNSSHCRHDAVSITPCVNARLNPRTWVQVGGLQFKGVFYTHMSHATSIAVCACL